MAASPPIYTPSVEVPIYSPEPSQEEERLIFVERTSSHTATFTQTIHDTTVIFYGQAEGVSRPTFGRHAVVNGAVCLNNVSDVLAVSVKISGHTCMSVGEDSSTKTDIFSETRTLWEKESGSPKPAAAPHLFSIPFPITYSLGTESRTLPPSYSREYYGTRGICVHVAYKLSVIIIRRAIWGIRRRESVEFSLNYCPRSRPYQPLPTHPFLSNLKSAPEEWYQSTSAITSKSNIDLNPIDLHLIIPVVRIFGLRDVIPVHIQLHSLPESLAALFSTSSSSSHTPPPYNLCSVDPSTSTSKYIRVTLQREVSVLWHRDKFSQTSVIGEGTLRHIQRGDTSDRTPNALSWEGEVRCSEDISVGGFRGVNIAVRDFIVVELDPPPDSPFPKHKHSHPVLMVTDSYREVHHPEDVL